MLTSPALPFALLIGVALGELALSGWWAGGYFRYGLPIFRMRVLSTAGLLAGMEDRLAQQFRDGVAPPIVFRRLSLSEIAFRERAWGFSLFHYTPIMHGLIHHVPEEGATYVTGRINAFPVALVCSIAFMFSSGAVDKTFYSIIGFVAAVFVLIYFAQAYRYRNVARSLYVD